MDTFFQDLRFGLRTLFKSPGFTIVAVLTLALGIGANTTIFSIVNGVMLNPLPFKEPDRLVNIYDNFHQKGLLKIDVSPAEFVDYTNRNQSFEQLAAYNTLNANLTGTGEPERVQAQLVTDNFFSVLGVQPPHGRFFLPEENQPGRDDVVVISDALWRSHYGSDPRLLEKTIVLDGRSLRVIGILPPGFKYPDNTDLWMPIVFTPDDLSSRGGRVLGVIGRLKPGIQPQQAQAEMDTIAAALQKQYPDYYDKTSGWGITAVPTKVQILGDITPALMILLGASAFVLLIACANVANLSLARSNSRQKEIALRTALGAGRTRIVRQLLTESLMLSLMGGGLGVLLAFFLVRLPAALRFEGIPRINEIAVDGRVLVFTLVISLLTGVLFGLAPALQVSKPQLGEFLQESSRGSSGGSRRRRLRNILVVIEIALALVLVICASLLIKSLARIQDVDPGFRTENVLTMQLSLSSSIYRDATQITNFYNQLLEQIGSLPQVKAAGAVTRLPLSGRKSDRSFLIEGRPDTYNAEWRLVSPNYFEALGNPIVKGRAFTQQDTQAVQSVAVINETMARRFWPDEDALGKRIRVTGPAALVPWLLIIGVVKDVKHYGLDAAAKPEMYFSYNQNPWPNAAQLARTLSIVARTSSDPASIVSAMRSRVWMIDKYQPVYNIKTMNEVLAGSLAPRRFNMVLLTIFASVALLLATVGIYGIMAYSVSQRTHEIGIRMALGAQQSVLMKMVLKQGVYIALIGIVIGVGLAYALTRIISSLLFGVSATDLTIFAATSVLLTAVALVASFIPARRAMKVDPMVALRYE
jgi:putative ABC transport system permease protein